MGEQDNMPHSVGVVHGVRVDVSVADQLLRVVDGGRVVAEYPVSTSQFGIGTEPGSFRTPPGRFEIAEKIGADAVAGAVFKGRLPTGEVASEGGDEDLILTRILWLNGLDAANANTRERFIYIHGTNQEARIGTPASHGCVRMKNADIVELFDRVPPGTPVNIIV